MNIFWGNEDLTELDKDNNKLLITFFNSISYFSERRHQDAEWNT